MKKYLSYVTLAALGLALGCADEAGTPISARSTSPVPLGDGGPAPSPGTPNPTPTTTPNPIPGGAPPAGACTACEAASCGSTLQSCESNPECVALFTCGQACAPGDQACLATCDSAHPTGLPSFEQHLQCLGELCASACGFDVTDTGGRGTADACSACVDTTCGDALARCSANSECAALDQCGLGCAPNDDSCLIQCDNQHPGGQTDFFTLLDCLDQGCQTACGGA